MIDLKRIDKNKQLIKIGTFSSIFLFIALILSLVFICINVNDNSAYVLRIVAITLSLIIGFAIIFFLTEFIYMKNIENKFLKILLEAEEKKYDGIVKEVGQTLTRKKYRKFLLIVIESGKDKITLNYDLTNSKCSLIKGNRYLFNTRNNYIISYEDMKNE